MVDVNAIKKEISVKAPIEKAFRVFTEGFDTWWPRAHHIGTAPMKLAIIEPTAGGKFYEIGEDGSTCDWGKVLLWEPPHRIVLAWQLTAEWKFDPKFITEVEVTFESKGADQTLVTLEHRNLDRFGDKAEAMMISFNSDGGWGGLLKIFVAEAEGNVDEKRRLLLAYAEQEA